jgi:hypothetical protein
MESTEVAIDSTVLGQQCSKSQIPNKFEAPIPNDQNDLVWNFEFRALKIVCYLVLGIWCLFPR